MPSGRVHNLINVATYSVLAAGVLLAARQDLLTVTPVQALSFSLAFFAGTLLLSPDLDLADGGGVDSQRRWGVLGVLWVPYGWLFRHRGLSHTWLLGPLTRLLYLGLWGLLFLGLVRFLWPEAPLPRVPQPVSLKVVLPLVLGYYLSQWLHLIADGVWPGHGWRQLRRKVGGRKRGAARSR